MERRQAGSSNSVRKLFVTGELDKWGYPKILTESEEKASDINKKSYKKLILSCSGKISFGTWGEYIIGDDKCNWRSWNLHYWTRWILYYDEIRETFNENIQDNSFMIHILNSLGTSRKNKDLRVHVEIVENMHIV